MDDKIFFDAHMHAFNLSHPSISSFAKRFVRDTLRSLRTLRRIPVLATLIALGVLILLVWTLFVLAYVVPPLRRLVRSWITRLAARGKKLLAASANLLVVLENDIGSSFLLIENCLRNPENPLLQHDGLHVGDEIYTHIVLTPLMMDFGYKGSQPAEQGRVPRFRYDMVAGKPIVEQVVDVFRAVRIYAESQSDRSLAGKFPSLHPGAKRIFEIYPFLGLNPANYSLDKVKGLLTKYFAGYTGQRDGFLASMGTFDGNIDHLGVHSFAGIKVYPPLGFDPWPEGNHEAMAKVDLLYETCSRMGIPITAHGGQGGFVVVDAKTLHEIASIHKWSSALKHFPELKVNLAHFPMAVAERTRRHEAIGLVLGYPNVYVDISCRATSEVYYKRLKALFDGMMRTELDVLQARILFGSDFAVNLMWIESYNRYVDLFSQTPSLTAAERHRFCSINPERFLFGGSNRRVQDSSRTA